MDSLPKELNDRQRDAARNAAIYNGIGDENIEDEENNFIPMDNMYNNVPVGKQPSNIMPNSQG